MGIATACSTRVTTARHCDAPIAETAPSHAPTRINATRTGTDLPSVAHRPHPAALSDAVRLDAGRRLSLLGGDAQRPRRGARGPPGNAREPRGARYRRDPHRSLT